MAGVVEVHNSSLPRQERSTGVIAPNKEREGETKREREREARLAQSRAARPAAAYAPGCFAKIRRARRRDDIGAPETAHTPALPPFRETPIPGCLISVFIFYRHSATALRRGTCHRLVQANGAQTRRRKPMERRWASRAHVGAPTSTRSTFICVV